MLIRKITRNLYFHFEIISYSLRKFENKFNTLLDNMKSNVCKSNLDKIKRLILKIKKYQHSGEFKKISVLMGKDKNLNIKEQYNNVKTYLKKYNEIKPNHYKTDYAELGENGNVNEKLVKEINSMCINVAKNTLLRILDNINHAIYKRSLICENKYYLAYATVYTPWMNECQNFDKTVYDKISYHISNNTKIFINKYYVLLYKNECIKQLTFKEEMYNKDFCCNMYYKKYEDILWDDISRIINKVFEK